MRVLIVDDERPAREGIRLRLQAEPDIEVIGETGEPDAAIRLIQERRPDLVFLDIRLHGDIDGLEVLRIASEEYLPAVIFTTAYDTYAVKAFEASAVDYLLKPYTASRFKEALARVRTEQARDAALELARERLSELLAEGGGKPRKRLEEPFEYAERLAVREKDRFVVVKAEDVDWITSAANYAELHSGTRTLLLRSTMAELEERLNPRRFARIHRATIVNLDRIGQIIPSEHGDYIVELLDKTRLRLSRTHRDRLMSQMYPYQRDDHRP